MSERKLQIGIIGIGAFCGDGSLENYWRRNPQEMGGGPFADTGSHVVDLGLWLGGARATSVSALMENGGLPVEQIVSVQARLENGVLLSIAVADGIKGKAGGQVTVMGDDGMLTAEFLRGGNPEEIRLNTKDGLELLETKYEDSNPAADFIASIGGSKVGGATGRDGANAVALTEAAFRSAREKATVEL